jgi:hypothetical protein
MYSKENASPAIGRHAPAQGAVAETKNPHLKPPVLVINPDSGRRITVALVKENLPQEVNPLKTLVSVYESTNEKKLLEHYLIESLYYEDVGYAILEYVRKQRTGVVDIEILRAGRRHLWNDYYEYLYHAGKITAQQLFDYVFKYKVAIQYTIRFRERCLTSIFHYRGETYYKGIDYAFTVVSPTCFPLDDTCEVFDIAVNDMLKHFGFFNEQGIFNDAAPDTPFEDPVIRNCGLFDITTGKQIKPTCQKLINDFAGKKIFNQ